MSKHHRALRDRERLRKAVLDRDGWRCRECGRAGALEAHHLHPLAKGGTDTMDNLVTLCRACHLEYHDPRGPERKRWDAYIRGIKTRRRLEDDF